MFGRIASVYDLLNHVLSFGIDRSWRRRLARLAVGPGTEVVLDLAAGTMDVSLALSHVAPAAKIVALDFCLPMLIRGLPKIKAAAGIYPCAADALALPVRDAVADSITIAFGIRNIPDRRDAFAEMLRALKPGGKLCVLEFGSAREKILGGSYNVYLRAMLPMAGKIIAHDRAAYEYLARTVREFPAAGQLAREMEQAGFVRVAWQRLTGGIVCLHWGFRPAQVF